MMRVLVFSILTLLLLSCQRKTPAALTRLDSFPTVEDLLPRDVDVWTPEGYPELGVTYKSLYMHDGQMLFDSINSWNHQEWMVDEWIQKLMDEEKIDPTIIIAVHNSKERFVDYTPKAPLTYINDSTYADLLDKRTDGMSPKSDIYLEFLVNTVKPYIGSHYPVSGEREDTFIAGSSMGGMISLYALMSYPEVFGGAACLSTHWPLSLDIEDERFTIAYIEYMRSRLPFEEKTKLYFDHGDQGLDALYPALQARVDSFFYNNDTWGMTYMSKAFPGHDHMERDWAKRLDIPLTFLLGTDQE
jgi:predicted alpha/beta superfamily hydrolase